MTAEPLPLDTPALPPDLDPSTHGLDPILVEEDLLDDSRAKAWRIEDDRAAEWAARHFSTATREIAELHRQGADWHAQIDRWLEGRLGPLERRRRFFEDALRGYQIRRRDSDPEAKTLTLPSATVRSRPALPDLVFDEDRLKVWSVDRPELVRVKVDPDIKAIRASFRVVDGKLVDPETGEVVSGATATPPPVPYTISVSPV